MKSDGILVAVKQQELLSRKISELPLKIEATHLRQLIHELYKELEMEGIAFKPKTYLSNGWGCPNEVPVIGIPFYLADPALSKLQSQMTGKNVEDDATIMMLLRHEAGHTFNYAYRIYDKPEWRKHFGLFSLPYQDDYRVDPLSNRFVHHLAGYYAQKHPDEDFAETFAVWLTPHSNWQKVYANTPALKKLQYVNKILAKYGEKTPIVTDGKLDMPVEEMAITLGEWYQTAYKNHDKRAARTK
jgi:Putative zinc-binding metallo-peptidase